MGRWTRLDQTTIDRIWRVKAEGVSWQGIERRFNISSWTVIRLKKDRQSTSQRQSGTEAGNLRQQVHPRKG
jgi:hypothetical protein